VLATDFVVNKSVEAVQSNAEPIVTKYTYDIVEAYVISSDENGNFFKTISPNFSYNYKASELV
jgi:hypothetical protein